MPQRSIRVANYKNRYRKFDFAFDTAKPFSGKKMKKAFDLTNDSCQEYFDAF